MFYCVVSLILNLVLSELMICLSPVSVSMNNHFEELMRRSPYEKSTGGISSHHSSFHLSVHSPHLSSGSPSGSSPFSSKHSTRKRGEN